MSDECKGNGSAVVLSFLVGAALGGGLALLLAPRSGEETRKQLRASGDDAVERLRGMISDAENKLREPIDEIQELLRDKKDIFLAAVEAGKQAAQEQSGQKPSGQKKQAGKA